MPPCPVAVTDRGSFRIEKDGRILSGTSTDGLKKLFAFKTMPGISKQRKSISIPYYILIIIYILPKLQNCNTFLGLLVSICDVDASGSFTNLVEKVRNGRSP